MNKNVPKFQLDQIALCPKNPTLARRLLVDLGLDQWVLDDVHASGIVRGVQCDNHALLQFNYQAGSGGLSDGETSRPLELEVLHYTAGHNWMEKSPNTVSHLGMHVTEEQLEQFRAYFTYHGIGVVQEVNTQAHTNPAIKDTRRYHYAIFDTRDILGVDLKFIVRYVLEPMTYSSPASFKTSNTKTATTTQDDWPVQGAKAKKAKK